MIIFSFWEMMYWKCSKYYSRYKSFVTVLPIVISELLFGIAVINECLPGICLNNGTCTDLVNAYRCDCVLGFDGTNCENSTYRIFCSQNLFRINRHQSSYVFYVVVLHLVRFWMLLLECECILKRGIEDGVFVLITVAWLSRYLLHFCFQIPTSVRRSRVKITELV